MKLHSWPVDEKALCTGIVSGYLMQKPLTVKTTKSTLNVSQGTYSLQYYYALHAVFVHKFGIFTSLTLDSLQI